MFHHGSIIQTTVFLPRFGTTGSAMGDEEVYSMNKYSSTKGFYDFKNLCALLSQTDVTLFIK